MSAPVSRREFAKAAAGTSLGGGRRSLEHETGGRSSAAGADYAALYRSVYVDFKTQKRTPKLSAEWFREAARRNAVV